ncbi:MAG: hypothetical protein ACI9RU_000231 [Litorivivens sp.]|jgi:hypothetical protein
MLCAPSLIAQSITEVPKTASWSEKIVDLEIANIPSTPNNSIDSLDPVRFVWKPAQNIRTGRIFINSQGNRHNLVLEKDQVSELPILSLTTDAPNLFDEKVGILVPGVNWTEKRPLYSGNYQQRGLEWERPVSISYYENGRLAFQTNCGLRTHGLLARAAPQKSLRLCERLELNAVGLDYSFFGKEQILPYLLLRSPFSSHSGNVIADMVVHNAARKTQIASIAFQPVSLYVNGVYWGLMNLRPRPDESFLANFHGVNLDQVVMDDQFQDSTLLHLLGFINKSNSDDANSLDSISQLLNIENFIDYMILETFFRNLDWAGDNNVQFYRIENGPLHLALIDLDATFQVEDQDMYAHIQEKDNCISSIWSALRANTQFSSAYAERYKELSASCLNTTYITASIDSISAMIAPEIESQISRWNYPEKYITWQESLRDMRKFALNRPHYAAVHLNSELGYAAVIEPEMKSNLSNMTKFILQQYKMWVAGLFLLLIAIGVLLVFKRN